MIRHNHHPEISRLGYVVRALLLVACASLLVFCMPHSGNQLQEVKKDQLWTGRPLYAEDNFPLLKAEETLQQEVEEALRDFRPYFIADAQLCEQQCEEFERFFDEQMTGKMSPHYRKRVLEKLRDVYKAGVVTQEDLTKLQEQNARGIVIVGEGNAATVMDISMIFTEKSAYEYMMREENQKVYEHDALVNLNLMNYIVPNLKYDHERSESIRQDMVHNVHPYDGVVTKGQKIVEPGDIVRGETYDMLRSLKEYEKGNERSSKEIYLQLLGQTVYVTLVLVCLLVFFNQFRSDYLQDWRTVLMVLLLTLSFPIITYAVKNYSMLPAYFIPYCILPIFIRVFLDSRTAFMTHMSMVLLCALPLNMPYEFIVVQIVAGLVAVYGLRELAQRSDLFRAVMAVTLISLCCKGAFDLVAGSFSRNDYIAIVINGGLLLISYLLLIPFERLFKFTSMVTLAELSNTNNELLRRLSEEAPGTFQHSMQVANLAGEVATKLGAKSLLVRTAAFYHDIGKLQKPSFFTENQNGSSEHDYMSPIESSAIIRQHVQIGMKLAEQYRLPKVVREFIASHHGCGITKYFYVTYQNQHPGEKVNEDDFRYSGPNPSTVEQAILMMADSVEAASHSLQEYTEQSIHDLVQRIVDGQVADGFFNECAITLSDISVAKQVLEEKLKAIYHTRIVYPELKF